MAMAMTKFKSSARLFMWVCCFWVGFVIGQDLPAALQPPEGNSLKLRSSTSQGYYVYKCQNKKWVRISASAQLHNLADSKSLLGNYTLDYSPNDPSYVGKWFLRNDDSDFVESGAAFSVVAGRAIASNSQSKITYSVLAEARFHQNDMYRISYIQSLYRMGNIPKSLQSSNCSENSETRIPFEAEFRFYTQDLEPPKVPNSIQVVSGQMVEGFFCKGTVGYVFDGAAWQMTAIQGKLYNLPGGDELGSYYVKDKPDEHGGRFCLQTKNPNGWLIVAKTAGPSVTVAKNSLPWSLFQVTSSTGNVSLLGPFKYYQLVGTRGGVPPHLSKNTKKGATWEGQFSSQFWIYK